MVDGMNLDFRVVVLAENWKISILVTEYVGDKFEMSPIQLLTLLLEVWYKKNIQKLSLSMVFVLYYF